MPETSFDFFDCNMDFINFWLRKGHQCLVIRKGT